MILLTLLSLLHLFQSGHKMDEGIRIGQSRIEFLQLMSRQPRAVRATVTKQDRKIYADQSPDTNGILKFTRFEIDSIPGSLLVIISGGMVQYAWWQESRDHTNSNAITDAHTLKRYYQICYGKPFFSDTKISKFSYKEEEVVVGVQSTPHGKQAFMVKDRTQ